MTAGRDAVRMGEDELADFLGSQVKVQVATNGPHGVPHLTTLFYALDAGRVAFWTYARSQKVRNLRRDPRLACLVEDGTAYAELRGASVTGTAEVVEDEARVREIGTAVVARMLGLPGPERLGDLGEEAVEAVALQVAAQARKRVAVVVHPEHVATWDHRKLGSPPTGP